MCWLRIVIVKFSDVHIFWLVNIFLCVITWRLLSCSDVLSNYEIIHDHVRWPVGINKLTHECKPRGVCMFMVKISLKRHTLPTAYLSLSNSR